MASSDSALTESSAADSREDRIGKVVADCLDRLNAGESVDIEEVIRVHPELKPDLAETLEALDEFEEALRSEASVSSLGGDYRILREVGRGGMGIVYEAWQNSTLRRVALKVLPENRLSDAMAVERFRREGRAAARLDHPGICTIYDLGVAGGCPYIAMRFVDGETLAERIRKQRERLGWRDPGEDGSPARAGEAAGEPARDPGTASSAAEVDETLRLIESAARALHSAHEAGLVHRDIKPANIMVTADGNPVILDFGLVRCDVSDETLTQSSALVGTPAYMSPEQVSGDRLIVDRRTDVYALGVTLYECLTSRLPYRAPNLERLFHKILSEQPPDARRLNRRVSADLWVVLQTALEKDLGRRYHSALDFAQDLRRVRQFQPIEARPASVLRRLWRWTQRNPPLAAAVCGLFLALTIGLAAALALLEKVREESGQKSVIVERLNRRTSELAVALRGEEGLRLASQSTNLLAEDPTLALLLALEANERRDHLLSRNALVASLSVLEEERTLIGHRGIVQDVSFSPDGTRALTVSHDGTARLWDPETGKEIVKLGMHRDGAWAACFREDGRRVITGGGNGDAIVWDAVSGAEIARLIGHRGRVNTAVFSADGSRTLTASGDGTARLWDAESGAPLHTLAGHQGAVVSAAFGSGGSTVLTAGEDGTARLWDTASGKEVLKLSGHTAALRAAALSPDGSLAATASADLTARLWRLQDGEPLFTLRHEHPVVAVKFSPDSSLVASTDVNAYIWSAETGERLAVLTPHEGGLMAVSFSPNGEEVVTTSAGGDARVWHARTGKEVSILQGHAGVVMAACFSPDGRRIATAGADWLARVWRARPGTRAGGVLRLRGHRGPVTSAEFSPDGRTVATASADGSARLWSAGDGSELAVIDDLLGPLRAACFRPGARELLTAFENGGVVVRELPDQRVLWSIADQPAPVTSAAYSPDGRFFVTAGADGRARIWSADTGRGLLTLSGHEGSLSSAVFSPDGGRLLTASVDCTVRVWDARDGGLLVLLPRNQELFRAASFSPDGSRILTVSVGMEVQVWDAASARRVAAWRTHSSPGYHGAYSPDGRLVVTAANDRTARLWEASSHEEILTLKGHSGAVLHAAFSFDGRRLVTASGDGTAVIWPLEARETASRLKPRDLTIAERNVYGLAAAGDHGALEDAEWRSIHDAMTVAIFWVGESFHPQFYADALSGLQELAARTGSDAKRFQCVTSHIRETALLLGRDDADLAAVLAECLRGAGEAQKAILALESAMRLEDAEVRHREKLLQYRREQEPELLTFASIDAALAARASSEGGEGAEALEELRAPAEEPAGRRPSRAERLEYLASRRDQEAGRHRDAIHRFDRLRDALPDHTEPLVRAIESLEALGDLSGAEDRLRRALSADGRKSAELWGLWFRLSACHAKKSPAEVLEALPAGAAPPAGGPGADLRWALEELRDRRAVRLNSGGEAYVDASGAVWGKDRFYRGGFRFFGDRSGGGSAPFTGPIARTDRDPLYQTERSFPRSTVPPRGYSLPLPPGRYRLTLHFAEILHREPGRRTFDVFVERSRVLAGHEPFRAGFAAAEDWSFEVKVDDGFLDVVFEPQAGSAKVSAIEVLRLD
jgi:WD40 repeat protein/tRNA A-37 threonylcarbamoyl transferase component Bud32